MTFPDALVQIFTNKDFLNSMSGIFLSLIVGYLVMKILSTPVVISKDTEEDNEE